MLNEGSLISNFIMSLFFLFKFPQSNPFSVFLLITFIHYEYIIIIIMKSINKMRDNFYSNFNTSVNSPNSSIARERHMRQNKFIAKYQTRARSESNISSISDRGSVSNGVKLKNSYYNNHRSDYLSQSQLLADNSVNYKAKCISFSERKRYQSGKTQSIIKKRQQELQNLEKQKNITIKERRHILQNPEITYEKRSQLKKRYNSLVISKFNKLMYENKEIKVKKRLLDEEIKRNIDQKSKGRKWSSPFLNQNTMKQIFDGKKLISNPVQKIYGNQDPNQLKVMNLDRLFRKKNGSLTNIVPIPVMKMSAVTSRQNVIKTIKNKDKIHDAIDEYNKLLKIMKLLKTMPKIGVKGKQFTKGPTLQELMGIKLRVSVPALPQVQQEVSEEIFTQYCQFYKNTIKKDVTLSKRVISGIKQLEKGITLSVFIRFYVIFVNHLASMAEKIQFLIYFFIPEGQDKIDYEMFKLILQTMCQELPTIQKLNLRTDFLTKQQKSKIFLQALKRVLFSNLEQKHSKKHISRASLKQIMQSNIQATDLLIKLLQVNE